MKRKHVLFVLVFVFLLSAALVGCGNGDKKGSLTGKIYDKETKDLINQKALVTFGPESLSVENGKFLFGNLSAGKNTLKVKVEGYDEYSAQVTIKVGETITHDVNLQKEGLPRVAKPIFNPAAGVYDETIEVSISCASEGATIRYTLDGSLPSLEEGEIYSGPITISRSTILQALAYKEDWEPSELASASYEIEGTVSMPTFNPTAGSYDESQEVTISCATAQAKIYYTMDGSEPSDKSTLYEAPLPITRSTSIKAIAYREGWEESQIAQAVYKLEAAKPEFTPAGGIYDDNQEIAISCTSKNVTIRYSLDGTDPTKDIGEIYTKPIVIDKGTYLKALAYSENLEPSAVVEAVYVFQTAKPKINVASGNYDKALEVSISTSTEGSIIRYTTDGTEPTPELGDVYISPLTIDRSTVLKAIAYKKGWRASEVVTANYGIIGTVATPSFTPAGGSYSENQEVTINCSTPETKIYYTLDGSEPSDKSALYKNPLTVDRTTTIRAIAFREGWGHSQLALAVYTLETAEPIISLASGTFKEEKEVTITCPSGGASIRYTTDGSTPTASLGEIYKGPITISQSTTLKAIAYKEGWEASGLVETNYVLETKSPIITPEGGIYEQAQEITIFCETQGTSIRYTIDGSMPSKEHGEIYTKPFTINRSTTLHAIAYKEGWTPSEVSIARYEIEGTVKIPTFNPAAGNYDESKEVTISCDTPGAKIYYTMDGSEPNDQSTLYETPLTIKSTSTIKAIAYKEGLSHSQIAVADYVLRSLPPEITPEGGSYGLEQTVTISCATAGASIRYTLDSSTPTNEHGEIYTSPITIKQSTVLKALAFKENLENSQVVEAIYSLELAKPEIDIPGGIYYESFEVNLICDSPGYSIRYTKDGTKPSAELGEEYNDPITIDKSISLKAIAYREGWETSPLLEEEYELVAGTPIFNPRGGNYNEELGVQLSSVTSGAIIRYTLDETEPTEEYGTIFDGKNIVISDESTIKAIAYKEGFTTSPVISQSYLFPEIYKSILIGINEVLLPKKDDDLIYYPGLSWEWDEVRQTGELVLDGYHGEKILEGFATDNWNLNIRVEGDSSIDGGYDSALAFDGVFIRGNPSATLTIMSGGVCALSYRQIELEIEETKVLVNYRRLYGSNHTTVAINADYVTLRNGAQLELNIVDAYGNLPKGVIGIKGKLTLEDTAKTSISLDWLDGSKLTTIYGVGDLVLNGTGSCEISITSHPTQATKAVNNGEPIIAPAYFTLGNWQDNYVKYFVCEGTIDDPIITPPSGKYNEAQLITIDCASPGVDIYYTTDGSLPADGAKPSDDSILYLGPFMVEESTGIKAIALKENWLPSSIVESSYSFGEIYGTIKIGGESIYLMKANDKIPGHYGLAWEWDEAKQDGQLVMNSYYGPGIHYDNDPNIDQIKIRIDSSSTINAGNEEALNFPAGIILESLSGAKLTIKSNAETAISCTEGLIEIKGLELRGELNHSHLTSNPTCGIKGAINLSQGSNMEFNFSRSGQNKKLLTAIEGRLTMEDTCGVDLQIDATSASSGAFGARDLTLAGVGTLIIKIEGKNGLTEGCRAIISTPEIINTGYVYQGNPQTDSVKYYFPIANPQFSLAAGNYYEPQTVSITCGTEETIIRYTTDGSTPTESHGTIYANPLSIDRTTQLKAVAYKEGREKSWVTSSTYTLIVADPVVTPAGGVYAGSQTVTIKCSNPEATIRFTTNGTSPGGPNGTVYTSPFTIDRPCTLKVIAEREGFEPSKVIIESYIIGSTYGTIKVNGNEVTLPKLNHTFHEYPGLSWVWNSFTQRGGLVLDGFHGTSIIGGSITGIDIYLESDSSLDATISGDNSMCALGFADDVRIDGRLVGNTFPTLRLESNYKNVVIIPQKVLEVKNVNLVIKGKQTFLSDYNDAVAVLGHITLLDNATLDLTVERMPGKNWMAKDLIGVSGWLTLNYNASAHVKLLGDNQVIFAKHGVNYLRLLGTGTCEIDVAYNPNEYPISAVRMRYEIEGDYNVYGSPDERWVKYVHK